MDTGLVLQLCADIRDLSGRPPLPLAGGVSGFAGELADLLESYAKQLGVSPRLFDTDSASAYRSLPERRSRQAAMKVWYHLKRSEEEPA